MHQVFKSAFILGLFSLLNTVAKAQDVAIGQWRDQLSYKQGVCVTEGGGKVYCASTSGLFAFNKSDNSCERLSKINGFSDIGVTAIGFNKYNNVLVIAYQDANIDLVTQGKVFNMPDIKNKSIVGNKTINSIYFSNEYAYLACGFGIVVLNTDKKEVKDTYYIGPGGGYINIRGITSDATNLYASTDQGIYKAALNSFNLADFNFWSKCTGLPNGIYNTIAYFNKKIYTNFSRNLTDGTWDGDSIFVYNGLTWMHSSPPPPALPNYVIEDMKAFNDTTLVVTEYDNINSYDTNLTRKNHIYNYGNGFSAITPQKSVLDENQNLWIADSKYGLIKNWSTSNNEALSPTGPSTSNVYAMSLVNDAMWIVPGGVNLAWGNVYNKDGVSCFRSNSWSSIYGNQPAVNASMDTIYDLIAIAVDPTNTNHAYAGCWSKGILEFNNGSLVKIYNETNSSLSKVQIGSFYRLYVGGVAFDNSNNLWVTNSQTTKVLSVKKANGTWQSLDFASFVDASVIAERVMITQSGQKWVVLPQSNGILVYQDNGTFAPPNVSNTKKLSTQTGNGALPINDVYSFAEDKNGEIWVGTGKGIAVFYSPESIFSGNNWDSKQILIEQDGHVQILLGTEVVTAIAVDGANRKWIGTENSGVFLMSEDGTQQIYHFDVDNSPLFSNQINSIVIDPKTGEVFFGTAKGIISYKSTATEGLDDFQNVYAYPNPVKEGYTGVIAITGLVSDADVKITDISGAVIYSTKAQGGQATWDGKNFKGEKAHTGVYMVYCSNSDGSKTYVTKILFVN